ncbi:MAG: PD40 domain-containing protein, partial [Thermoleophilia bacterium]|nr:PD40 domain-containing protein [Thermoleophilia bacterium]
ALAAPAVAAPGDLDLVSRADGPAGAPASTEGSVPGQAGISANGRIVVFQSGADNLSLEDDNARTNVFARDLLTGTTTLVSRATGVAGPAANADSANPAISSDGRFVAFASDAANLSDEDDPDPYDDVFVRDLLLGTTTLVSRATGPAGAGGNDHSSSPMISKDGRHVVFLSDADNLSGEDIDTFTNVFVRDLVAGTTTLVSRSPGPTGAAGNGNARSPSISDSGTRVAFPSGANNLSTEDDNSVFNVFVRDLANDTITLVSRADGAGGAVANGVSTDSGISPSGRYVAFSSAANNLSAEDDNGAENVFLRDLDLATTTLVNRADGPSGAPANAGPPAENYGPMVSDNGRVVFASVATNLATGDNPDGDVFVRDPAAGTTELVSRAAGVGGAPADGLSTLATMSGDGRWVAFASVATNLVAGTVAGTSNTFRRDLLGDAPVSTPACKSVPLPPAPSGATGPITLTSGQLLINQRIGQAAIRRLNAVEGRLGGGLQTRDLCGYSVGGGQLGLGITTATAAVSLAPSVPADPAPIVDPGRQGTGDPVTLSAAQLLINQRIYQAAIRRADGIESRLDTGLTGGDVRTGAVTQGKLFDRLQVLAAVPVAEPAASVTVIPPRTGTGDPSSVTLSAAQLAINQRIAQAAVRRSNALIRRLEIGLSGEDLRAGTLTAADLG